MAETSGCCPASAKADYMIKVIVLRVHRATASSGLPPKPDISLRRLGDAKGRAMAQSQAALQPAARGGRSREAGSRPRGRQ